jgi:4-hydroxybenzoate polyprenyltransferase
MSSTTPLLQTAPSAANKGVPYSDQPLARDAAGLGSPPARARTAAKPPETFAERLWVYQRERFPLVGHGLLIGAFSFSAVSFSFLLRGGQGVPAISSVVVAFVSSFFFFFQLRVADEFKDFEEDAQWRPYRPVPRGLITLRELAMLAVAGGAIQAVLAAGFSWRLVALLLLVWGYLALMTKEFFVRDWIQHRPITYLWTHMLVIPMADFYATACDWTRAGFAPPEGLFWFLAASFCNGVTLELGRKIRAPADEEEGVRTYSALWGCGRATAAWLGALGATGACAAAAALRTGFLGINASLFGGMLLLAAFFGAEFLKTPSSQRAKAIETFSGIWTLVMYFSLGLIPLLGAWVRGHL